MSISVCTLRMALLVGLLLQAAAPDATAQLAPENFNSGTLPTGWTLINDGHTVSQYTIYGTDVALTNAAWIPYQVSGSSQGYSMLTTSLFNPAAKADRWLISPPFTVNGAGAVIQWDDFSLQYYTYGHPAEYLQVLVSPGTGANPATFTPIYDDSVSHEEYGTHAVSLGNWNGQTVRVAFRDTSTNKSFMVVDNIKTQLLTVLDGALTGLTFPGYVAATTPTPVSVTVSNPGATVITSLTIAYQVDNGTAMSQTFSGLHMLPYKTQTLNMATPVGATAIGTHNLVVSITGVNGTADQLASNNTLTKSFITAGQSTVRTGLIEDFSSSTCGPCIIRNFTYDPLVESNHPNRDTSHLNVIKYQMDWPSPGDDPSYNQVGAARQSFYSVSGIPEHYINGIYGKDWDQAEIDRAKSTPAFMAISGSYMIKNDSFFATATVTPYFTATGYYQVHLAIAETHYHYNRDSIMGLPSVNPQNDYYHVMRNMMNAGHGTTITSWVTNQPQTFSWKGHYTVGNVVSGTNNFWGPAIGTELLIYVQDHATQDILQSKATPAQWPAGVSDPADLLGSVAVYPNPATGSSQLFFHLSEGAAVEVQVTDLSGRRCGSVPARILSAGAHILPLPLAGLAAGMYMVQLTAGGQRVTRQLSVLR